ncbi:hypothetical protein CANCADRAFT_17622, partial [Tortispora caseinolytica NRRL Y-17796]
MDFFGSLSASGLSSQPTLFEIISAEELSSLLAPSLRYVVAYTAQRHPRYLLKIAHRFDEIYLALSAVIEYQFLKRHNSSFAENFYGLKRVRTLAIDPAALNDYAPKQIRDAQRLKRHQIIGHLFVLVVLPYINEKISRRYELLIARSAFGTHTQSEPSSHYERLTQFTDHLILHYYPAAKACLTLSNVGFSAFYLFQASNAHNLADYLLNTSYARLTSFDYDTPATQQDEDPKTLSEKLAFLCSLQGLKLVESSVLDSLQTMLATAMFGLKFAEWWAASDIGTQLSMKHRSGVDSVLPPPTGANTVLQKVEEKPTMELKALSDDNQSCPICHESITNPAIIETGFVFCYTCIFRILSDAPQETGGRCPVTGQRLLGARYIENQEQWEITGIRRLII